MLPVGGSVSMQYMDPEASKNTAASKRGTLFDWPESDQFDPVIRETTTYIRGLLD
jgi:hypothetical protein